MEPVIEHSDENLIRCPGCGESSWNAEYKVTVEQPCKVWGRIDEDGRVEVEDWDYTDAYVAVDDTEGDNEFLSCRECLFVFDIETGEGRVR